MRILNAAKTCLSFLSKTTALVFFLLVLTLIFLNSAVFSAFQTNSNTVVTRVGDSSTRSGILDGALTIIPLLTRGTEGLYNIKVNEPGVYYWCTYLIIDSYNKAGYNELTRAGDGSVLIMKSHFANTPVYRLLPPSTPVEQLSPGNIIFFEGKGHHVSLIKAVDVDENGNGTIRTLDANNVVTEDVVFVRNHTAIRAQTTSRIYSITGFGQVTR